MTNDWTVGARPENIGKMVLVQISDHTDGKIDPATTRKYVGVLKAIYTAPAEVGVQLDGVANWQIAKRDAKCMEIIPVPQTS